jgi:hypothetical protein
MVAVVPVVLLAATLVITGGTPAETKSIPSMVPGGTVIAPPYNGTPFVVTILTQGLDVSLLQVSIVPPAIVRTRVVTDVGTSDPVSVKVWLLDGSVFTKAHERLLLLMKQ